MEKTAMGRSLSQDDEEKWMSMPASSSRSSTPEAQALTRSPFQPPDSFLGGERSMSPPPVTLEKAMDPSLGSQPSTPATSIISFLSRSDTGRSQDSDNTLYSQNSSSFDGTVLLPRKSNFPAMGSHPVDHNSLPKGAAIRLFELPKSRLEYRPAPTYPSRVSIPVDQPGSSRIHRYPTWPKRQGQENRDLNNQAPPSRHSTFPIGKSSNTTEPKNTHSFVFEATENRNIPGSAKIGDLLPEDMDLPDTDMPVYDNAFRQEMAPDETAIFNFQAQKDMILTTALMTSKQLMFDSIDSKYDGLHCERAPKCSAELVSQLRKKPFQKFSMLQGLESAGIAEPVASKYSESDRERSCSPDSVVFPATRTIITSEAAIAPRDINRKEVETQAEDQKSCASSPSPPGKLCGERNRHESFWPDSEENAVCLHEDCDHPNEGDEDSTYDELAAGITNLVLESSCVGNVEDGGVPIKLYVHNFLQKVLNHPKTLCLPIRNLHTPKHETPGDTGESGMRAGIQSSNGGGSGTNKRKSEEIPGDTRDCSNEDQGSFGDEDQEDLQSHSSQKVKKQRTGKKGGNFSCPFRKRNPIRFNVRDHESCALKPFTDFALLKRHIKTFHQRANSSSSCVRCKEQFPDQAALNRHLTRPDICEVLNFTGNVDHEDGITEEIDRKLKIRTKDDNVRQWESLWTLLFPDDDSERIPGPEHEPPIELDEVQDHCYKEDSISEFISREIMNGQMVMTDHGFRYFVERFRHCRNKESHEPSNERFKRDKRFMVKVNDELPGPFARRGSSPAQQTCGVVVNDQPHVATPPPQWEYNFETSLFPDLYANQYSSYPTQPPYATHLGGNGSQVPASATMYPSSEHGPVHHAAPQNALTTIPYPVLPSNGSPCSAAGRSAHRSSRPSSQSLDSSYHTQATQETQDTQFTHPYATAFHQHRPDEGVPGGPAGACSCSTSPGGIPADQHFCTEVPGQGFSEHNLRGVGMRSAECLAGSNSDDDLIPLHGPHPGMS